MDNTADTASLIGLAVKHLLGPFKALHARLKARTDSEHEQAILRIVLVSVVLAYMGTAYSYGAAGGRDADPLLVLGLEADLVLAIALFAGVCIWPAASIRRRVTGMLADAGAATFCMFLAGETGISMIGIYLFITSWNEYLFALMMTGRNVRTVTVALQLFIGENQIQWGLLMAGGTLVALPATILFLFAQRRLVGGLTGGAVKG